MKERKRLAREWIVQEPFAYPPGKGNLYSDLGFMLLEWVIEARAGEGLGEYVKREFYDRLGLKRMFFGRNPPSPPFSKGGEEGDGTPPQPPFSKGGNLRRERKKDSPSPLSPPTRGGEQQEEKVDPRSGGEGEKEGRWPAGVRREDFAATEDCPWRKRILQGEVHDDNAYALGGCSAHAGLFGTAEEIWTLADILRQRYLGQRSEYFKPETVREFFRRQDIVEGSDWALGWDTRALEGSSAGRYFSRDSVGHTGFTGTSIWMDLEKDVVAILLSNRVHPTRENPEKMKAFRPKIHDRIMQELGLD
jgi:CubicO group peptidase (beta-lactamase class C family)